MSTHANGLMPMLIFLLLMLALLGLRLLLPNPARANVQHQGLPVAKERKTKRGKGLPVCLHDFEKHCWIELISDILRTCTKGVTYGSGGFAIGIAFGVGVQWMMQWLRRQGASSDQQVDSTTLWLGKGMTVSCTSAPLCGVQK